MEKLVHVVTNNIKIKDQCNDAIFYETKFDNTFSSFSDRNRDTLSVVTVTSYEEIKIGQI